MELRYLTTFLQVARLQSFTAAAAGLGYAQSTITSHVKILEAALGAELFDRATGRVELTGAGERLLPYAERMIDLADEARLAVKEPDTGGTVIVGAVESIATYRLSQVVEFFHHRFPEMRLIVRTSSCPDTELALRRGELDLGFLMAADTSHPGLSGITLCREDLVVVAAPEHPLAGAAEVTTDELRKAVILNTEYGCPYRETFEVALSEGEESVRLLEFGTIGAIKQMAANGLGVALLPRFAVAGEFAAGELVEVAWKTPFTFYTQVAWRKGKWISKALQLFVDQTVKVFCAED